jgi:hypothetical protein
MVDITLFTKEELLDFIQKTEESKEPKEIDFKLDWEFTDNIRNNRFKGGKYGSSNMTFSHLYKLLVIQNNGVDFISRYFDSVYPNTHTKKTVDRHFEKIKNTVEKLKQLKKDYKEEAIEQIETMKFTKKGLLNKRYKRKIRELTEIIDYYYNSIKEEEKRLDTRKISLLIKNDIKRKTSSGQLPLVNKTLKLSTMKRRLRADLPDKPKLYASGQFIDNIVIKVNLGEKK